MVFLGALDHTTLKKECIAKDKQREEENVRCLVSFVLVDICVEWKEIHLSFASVRLPLLVSPHKMVLFQAEESQFQLVSRLPFHVHARPQWEGTGTDGHPCRGSR